MRMKIIRFPLMVACASALIMSSLPAAANEGFFSKDGQTVTLGLGERGISGLLQVEIATGKVTQAPLSAELKDESIDSVACGSEGEALFLAKNGVWVWTPGAAIPVKHVCPTAPAMNAMELFVSTVPGTPFTDCLFVSGNETADAGSLGSFYGRRPGAKNAFQSVFCRRVSDVTGGIFSTDGRLFFISRGDVWEGGFQPNEDNGMDRLGTLVGARIAPLAALYTDEASGGSLWAEHVAPAGGWLYVQMRGRHMATVLRLPLPAKPLYTPASQDTPGTKDQLSVMSHALARTEVIAEDMEFASGFCATEVDGKPRIFYVSDMEGEKGLAMMLWEGAGKPRVIGHLPRE